MKTRVAGFSGRSACESFFLGGWIMSAPLPDALRARFKACIEEGLSGRAAAARLKLSPATGTQWARAIRQHGAAAPAPQGRPRERGKLAPHQAFLEELVAHDPDIRSTSCAIPWPWPKACRFTTPRVQRCSSGSGSAIKRSLVASEQHRARAKQARRDWLEGRITFMRRQPERHVFIEEPQVRAAKPV